MQNLNPTWYLTPRSNWTKEEITTLYNLPLFQLILAASQVTAVSHSAAEVQVCQLLSIKTGGCTENCKYCAQSIHYETGLKATPLMKQEEVMSEAKKAKDSGATRFCMGAAWREVKDNRTFDLVLDMIRGVKSLDLEVCCTLGMVNEEQAKKLKEAGLYAYNHNLDTSENFYKEVITSRTYDDRLQTLDAVRKAGLTVCCGGILGLGESKQDRIDLLQTLATFSPHPESVPINCLVPIEGTPFEENSPITKWELIRTIAAARLLMPKSMVRLSAGRLSMSEELQALCFLAGANSIFGGEKLLTTANPEVDADKALFEALGLSQRPAYAKEARESCINSTDSSCESKGGCGCQSSVHA